MLRVRAAVFLLFRPAFLPALPLLFLAQAAAAQPCQCIDVGDLKQRIKEAEVAINAYTTEMNKMVEQIQRTHEPIEYTPARREKLQGRVQAALNQVTAGRISVAPTMGDNPGGTDNLCRTTINIHPRATACMRESVRRHEEYHKQQCERTLSVGSVLDSVRSGKDRFQRDGASLMEYAQEEIGGYNTELMYLHGELSRLQRAPECQPKQPERIDYTAQQRKSK